MKKLLVLILTSLACYPEPLVFVTGGSSGGSGGAVSSVNRQVGDVVLTGLDIALSTTTTTNVNDAVNNKLDKQYSSADDNKVLTVDPSDHKVRPMAVASSAISFQSVVPSTGASITAGDRGFAIASRGSKSLMFTYDSVGQTVPVDNVSGEIVLTYNASTKKIQVTGTSSATYSITLIKE